GGGLARGAGAEEGAFKRVRVETVEQLAREDATFKRAKLVFTESDERCALTAELDGVKREGVPLQIEIEQLEDAQSGAGARAQLKEAIRLYFRRGQGREGERGSCSIRGATACSAFRRACSPPRRAHASSAATSASARASECSRSAPASAWPRSSPRGRGRSWSPPTSCPARSRRCRPTRR